MAIESIKGGATNPSSIKTVQKAEVEGQKQATTKRIEKDDSIEITAVAQEIKKAFESSSGSAVDINRVNAVKKALAEGSYSINAERIAKKMIQFEKLMFQDNGT
jgi:negative regulator of flagellin synthesis FlgM